jgi:predicted ferric reductase
MTVGSRVVATPRTQAARTGDDRWLEWEDRTAGFEDDASQIWEDVDPPDDGPGNDAVLATPRWWSVVAAGLGWSSISVVVAFWMANAGAEGLHTVADLFDAAGRLTGLVSADLLLLQVVMMSRIPFLERSYGQDGLARIHRRLGMWSFTLLLAHIALITVGYARGNGMTIYRQFVELVTDESGVLLATAATAMLVLVVVTSIRTVRRWQRYETWHLLHLYAYLGIGLAIPHELALGGDLTASPAAMIYWWASYLIALAALLVWRVWLPLYRMLRFRLVVEHVVPEGPGVVSVYLRGHRLDRLKVGAGQFFLWRFISGRGWTRAHPYSLSAAPTADRLRITVKDLGDDSGRLRYLRPGTRVLAEGPFGRLHSGVRTRRKVTLLACGIGITPIRALLEELDYEPGDLTLIYRAGQRHELVLSEEIDELARRRGARVFYLLGPRRSTRRGGSWLPQSAGSITDGEGLRQLVPDIREHDVYVCGPEAWLDHVLRTLRQTGVPAANVHLERFSW